MIIERPFCRVATALRIHRNGGAANVDTSLMMGLALAKRDRSFDPTAYGDIAWVARSIFEGVAILLREGGCGGFLRGRLSLGDLVICQIHRYCCQLTLLIDLLR